MKGAPEVSVIIPVKGRAQYVHDVVRSVQRQSMDAFELLLCDDDSDARTLDTMRAAARDDVRIRILPRGARPPGGSARRNDGALAAHGRYLVFLDSDDLLRADCLRDRIAWLDARPDVGFAISECRVFEHVPGDTPYAFNVVSTENDLERFLRHDFPWQTAAPTWRADAFAKMGGWDETLPSWQDWDLHVRALVTDDLAYARTGAVDYFYRRTRGVALEGYAGLEHLHRRRGVLAKIATRLDTARQLGTRAAVLLAGLYFDVAWRLACAGFADEAVTLWNDAAVHGLVRARELREGEVMLRLAHREPLRPLLLRYRFWRWDADLHHTPSKTLLRAWALPYDVLR